MSAQMYQVSVTFHDVAACFSAEEWGLLEDWQKEVYRNVMTEIHSAMQAMGFEIINPDVLFRIKKVKEAYTSLGDMDRIITSAACPTGDPDHLMGIKHERLSHIDMGMKKGNKNPHPGCSPDILLRIKQEEQPAFTDPPERSATPSPVEPVVTSVFSLNINEEEEEGELHPADRPESKTTHPQKRLTSRPIKQEEVDYIKVSVGSHGSDRITTTSRERLTSRPIKQEEVDYIKVSVGSHGSDRITATSRERDTDMRTNQVDELWVSRPPEDSEIKERSNCSNQENGHEITNMKELPSTDYILNGSMYKWSGWHNHVGILSPLSQHRRDRPYQCNDCEKSYTEPSRFLRHQISHTGGRPYHCRHCIKTFRQPYELMVHQRVHTGEKPYHCTVCGKKFIKNSILKVHQRIHTGERPYKCTLCTKSFVQSHHLKTHQKTHTGVRVQNY